MLAGDGLNIRARRAPVWCSPGSERKVIHGPFARDPGAAGRLLGVEREVARGGDRVGRAAPLDPMPGSEAAIIEIRPVFESEDLGEERTPELRAREQKLRDRAGQSSESSGESATIGRTKREVRRGTGAASSRGARERSGFACEQPPPIGADVREAPRRSGGPSRRRTARARRRSRRG